MDYEKKYKESLEKARELYNDERTHVGMTPIYLTEIFPELKDSEDERIRKKLIDLIYKVYANTSYITCVEHEDMLSWIEKQSKKSQSKSALESINEEKVDNSNKVKPKFKIGDWVVDKSGFVQQVLDFREGIYICAYNSFTTNCESNYYLWTISDAKDGDVLCGFPKDNYPWLGIFCKLNNKDNFDSYCYLQAGRTGKFCPPNEKKYFW